MLLLLDEASALIYWENGRWQSRSMIRNMEEEDVKEIYDIRNCIYSSELL